MQGGYDETVAKTQLLKCEHASLMCCLGTELTLSGEEWTRLCTIFIFSAAGSTSATSDQMHLSSQACVYEKTVVSAHLSAFARLADLFVCMCYVSLHFCVWVRLWGIERAQTQVKPGGSQQDVFTRLWPPTVVKAFTVSIPSSLHPRHHLPFQSKRGHRWAHSDSHDCPTVTAFPYLLFLAQQAHICTSRTLCLQQMLKIKSWNHVMSYVFHKNFPF